MMVNRPKKQNISTQQVVAALLDDKNFFPPSYLHHLSDLEGADLAAIRSVWPQVSANRRFTLLEDLEELAETDTLVSFDSMAHIGLQDDDPRVRTIAIRLLWETEDQQFVPLFLKMLTHDPDDGVRAAAATALGLFIFLGELEEIPENLHHQVEDQLIKVVNGKDTELVRRHALESLGFSGRTEVPPLVRKAYENSDIKWLSSALCAMGRSADNAWAPEITRMLRHHQTTVQLEAIRAAGELELSAAQRILIQLLDDDLLESELRGAIYWSLSKIGGDEVRETLEKILEETEDDEEVALLEDAIENLDFSDDTNVFKMLDIDDLPEEDETMEEYLARRDSTRTVELDSDDLSIDDSIIDLPDEGSTPVKKDESKLDPGAGKKPHHPHRPE